MTHRMIVKTETVDRKGRALIITERIRCIPTDQVEQRRQAARQSAPRGATLTIKVMAED